MKIRLAFPSDSDAIAGILRSCFNERLLNYTIFRSELFSEYLRDVIRLQEYSRTTHFLVCIDRRETIGFAEFRYGLDAVFLNHIYVSPNVQRRGAGKKLVLCGLRRAHEFDLDTIHLDVFSDNFPAKKWYQSMGLKPSYKQVWMETPIPTATDPEGVTDHWNLLDFAEASRVQSHYGFSQFRLKTPKAQYKVGCLGTSLFRSTTFSILDDVQAANALRRIGPSRRILCIAPAEEMLIRPSVEETIIACSERLAGSVQTAIARLTAP